MKIRTRFQRRRNRPFLSSVAPLAISRQRAKCGVFDIPIEEALATSRRDETPPEHMANAVYLELFSERSGRVVVESADYPCKSPRPAWRYTKEEIAERHRRIA